MTDQPRGIRNNNPGNIDFNPIMPWKGLDTPPTDGRFCRFKTPEYGIRALARTLFNYQKLYNLTSIRQIIDRWAPPNENDTDSYVMSVARACGVSPTDKIDLILNPAILTALVKSIIRHENGIQPYLDKQIADGIYMSKI